MLPSRIRTAWLCCLLLTGGVLAEAPYVPPAEDVNHLGTQAASLFWTPKQQVAGYRNWDRIFPTRSILQWCSAVRLERQRSASWITRVNRSRS
jgi:hypothetical protein